ncbi:hypothetical protein FNI36_07050 [Salmonella enterica subsp. diarizonae]|nr:hypothetical protein [Salmonella enterica subsp. diarizonae]
MTYSILHLSRNNQRTHLMVDDVTTLPVMFVTIYGMNELSKKMRVWSCCYGSIASKYFISSW